MTAVRDREAGTGRELRTGPASGGGDLGEARVKVERRDGGGGRRGAPRGLRKGREQLAVDPLFDRADPLLGAEDLLLELLQGGRHEAFRIGEGLPPDPLRGDTLAMGLADLQRIAEDP